MDDSKDFAAYGIAKEGAASLDELSRIEQEVRYRGFSVCGGVFKNLSWFDDLSPRLDEIYAKQCAEVGGEAVLSSIEDDDVVRCPLAYDEIFLTVAQHEIILDVSRRLLGDNIVLLMQNGLINRPGRRHVQARWHRDLNYQHWVSSVPLAIGALVCLEDFGAETGGTAFLPGSHKFEALPPKELVAKCQTTVEASKGSILFFDAMSFHRGGSNRSRKIRRGINHVIGVPILGQQINVPAALGKPPPADSRLAGYLGYHWNPASSVREWRAKKIEQATGCA